MVPGQSRNNRTVVGGEEWRCAEGTATIGTVDLVVEETLDVIDGEEMLAIHGDDDGVPDL